MRHINYATQLLIGVVALLFGASTAFAGTLSLSPATGVYTAGDFFTVRVLANTQGSAINAAEGVISYNTSELQVVNVVNNGSIFNLWVTEPEYSASAGTITFAGGSPKGYTGTAGQIFTITFKALAEGISNVTWTSGVMSAADGKGTNVLSTMGTGKYTIAAKTETPAPEYIAPANTPAAPKVTSRTHPDPDKWYTAKDVEFSWSVPNDVTNVRLSADKNSGTTPTVFYDTPIKGKTLEDFDEGAWYLHVQFKNEDGWGRVAHFPFNIDATEPESFTITQVNPTADEPRLGFLFTAVDAVSGVSLYEISFDGKEPVMWQDDGTGIYYPEVLTPGSHTMFVRAIDGAGLSIAESITFNVAALQAPQITDYSDVIGSGGILVVRGVALPDSTITVYVQKKGEDAVDYSTITDENGGFTFIMEEVPSDGIYKIWAVATDFRGAMSDPSKKITIAVEPSELMKKGTAALNYMSVIVPLVALFILLILMLLYGVKKIREYRAVVRKEATEAEEVLHESFTKLHFEVEKHVKGLQSARRKRELTKSEEKLIDELSVSLDEAEKIVSKEIKDIKRVS